MTHTLAYVLGVLVLVLGVAVSVALHELGHMIPAKRFGVKVPEYFIGFGPRIWSTRRGETEYGVKAIWLGGYVKLLGMLPPAPPDRPDKPGSMIDEARRESLAELAEEDRDRAFYRLSVPRKLIVMAGGILTNLVLGVVCLVLAVGVVGQPARTSTLGSVTSCLPTDASGQDAPVEDCAAEEKTPAVRAGLRAGDTIVSWDGSTTSTWAEVQEAIGASGTRAVEVVIERDGARRTLSVTPVEVSRPVTDDNGAPVTGADGEQLTQMRPYVGIGPALGTVRVPPSQLPAVVGQAVTGTLKAIATLPVGLVHSVAAGLGIEERSSEGLVSLVGIGRMAGETTAAGAGSGTVPLSVRVSAMLSLLGALNLALFAFNLVPLPPLDGGHVAGACWEGLRRLLARMRGRPDPGHVDTARLLPVGQAVFVLLVIMAAVLIWVDIVAPL
ncbi:M50 family metallopeptidase [Actinomyces howellii]|uniref:Zinc metalloprotease SA1105 n=1 Tax=Actinomyces howellii TaxID=52771 RepID=A0A3S4RA43_9ACTO|nr:site-2 protease family protein [Actinomyces howellii]VEG26904.1 Putative zinc metalloprotease SA1105 [Actinomyces howellii]